jgi:hypothetical protein
MINCHSVLHGCIVVLPVDFEADIVTLHNIQPVIDSAQNEQYKV